MNEIENFINFISIKLVIKMKSSYKSGVIVDKVAEVYS